MASEIVVALISGGVGLTTGIIGSLVAPWANWGVEKRRRIQERRVERIKQWRDRADYIDFAERNHGRIIGGDEPVNSDVRKKDWFATLRPEMAPDILRKLEALCEQPVATRRGQVSKLIEHEITRIEREKWNLV